MRAVFVIIVTGAVIGWGQGPGPASTPAASAPNSSTIAGPAPGSLSVRLEDWGKLVLDLNIAYGGHRSIPAQNLALELMGKNTGAYEAVFSNDLDNLKSDKIRQ